MRSQTDGWLARLAAQRNANIAAVALANKNARIVWALLAHERDYQAGYVAPFGRRSGVSSLRQPRARRERFFQRNTYHRLHRRLRK